MLAITAIQIEKLRQGSEQLFRTRILELLEANYSELIGQVDKEMQPETILQAVTQARTLFIEIEQDIFDYVLFFFALDGGLLQHQSIKTQLDWFESPHVPSNIKIQRLRDCLYG
ncbi:MAG: hypothetical protein HRT35_02950 [Algicola sp.]|nr:hypothetical protein [Algicola sp.]